MSASGKVSLVAGSLLVACLAGSVAMLTRVDRLRSDATLHDVLYISSPQVLKRLSLGYSGLLADIYWTRAVQYFGNKHFEGGQDYELLAPLLEITTTLDPHLFAAYDFGSSFLAPKPPNGAGMPQRAIELARFGIRNNPDEWRLYYDLGFVYYMELKDYGHAAEAFEAGSRVPKAHPFLKVLAAQMAQHAGELQTAAMLWRATYETSSDASVRANAAAHLRALKVDADVTALEGLVSSYEKKTGRLPASFGDLIATRMLPGIPVDPMRNPYLLKPDGRIEVRDPDHLPFIDKGTPPGYVPPKKPSILPTD